MTPNQITVKISKYLSDEVDDWLDTDVAKKLGFITKSQVIDAALRDYLEEQKMKGFFFQGRVYNRLRKLYVKNLNYFEKHNITIVKYLEDNLEAYFSKKPETNSVGTSA